MIWRKLGHPPASPRDTPAPQLLWWEHRLAIEGLSDEAFAMSKGEHGAEGFIDTPTEMPFSTPEELADLGFAVRMRG